MNLDFMRLEATRRAAAPAQPDYYRLVAVLVAAQGTTRTAVLEARLGTPRVRCGTPIEALGTLIGACAGWEGAITALGGSFHPAIARHFAPKRDEAG